MSLRSEEINHASPDAYKDGGKVEPSPLPSPFAKGEGASPLSRPSAEGWERARVRAPSSPVANPWPDVSAVRSWSDPPEQAAPAVAAAAANTSQKYPDCAWTNPEGDEDSDGLTSAQEETIGTSPCDADTDGDDIPDGAEVLTPPRR